jgi:hypothetical protein
MFTRRRVLDRRRKYSRAFFESFVQRLRDAGFDELSVILPHNYPSVDPRNSIVSLEEFLNRERNFAAIILKARCTTRDEIMKVLFVNSSAQAIFVDDTFPSAASEPSSLFFQSPDPARAFALFEYFYEVLSVSSIMSFVLLSLAGLASIVVIITELLVVASKKSGLLQQFFSLPAHWDYLTMALSVWVAYKFFRAPTGLWIKPTRELRILGMIKMAIRGEYRDNPIVQLVVTVVGGLIVAIILRILKILP